MAQKVYTCKFVSLSRPSPRHSFNWQLTQHFSARFMFVLFDIKIGLRDRKSRIALVRYCANIDGLGFCLRFRFNGLGCHANLRNFLIFTHCCVWSTSVQFKWFNSLFSFLSHNYSNLQRAFPVEVYRKRVFHVATEARDTTRMLRPIAKLITCAINREDNSVMFAPMRHFSSSAC